MTVYLAIFLPIILYRHRIYLVLANPIYEQGCKRARLFMAAKSWHWSIMKLCFRIQARWLDEMSWISIGYRSAKMLKVADGRSVQRVQVKVHVDLTFFNGFKWIITAKGGTAHSVFVILGTAAQNTPLAHLDLSQNTFTGAGMKHFAKGGRDRMGMTSCMLWCIVHCNCKMQMHDELHVIMCGILKCKIEARPTAICSLRGRGQLPVAWSVNTIWLIVMLNSPYNLCPYDLTLDAWHTQ